MAQTGTQVCLLTAIVSSVHVHVCVSLCLHVTQCVYQASAWEEEEEEHKTTQEQTYYDTHLPIVNLSELPPASQTRSETDWMLFHHFP